MERKTGPEREIIPRHLREDENLPESVSGSEYRQWQLELVAEKYLPGYDPKQEDRDIKLESEAFTRWIKEGYAEKYKDFWGPKIV
ncbi:hypothetical protein A2303_02680 [Candidatus Falkowbacteria bacterium RIFOXYB2_FULL_47_14]|uniref:Uncharacterized protein n=1 Tax=Candidatus Falkowbacteria bacterium RIFOXYA2_FULL_47_19 TaxID=1797994 RepID=A0A1F5SHF4_9BACT|nr:MAG: hypothetical protein A2227_05750 [Candidatus Falkowbacteria bacterium RIFOXYA2_FULL_47_19]OGF34517.1 MAG: hypothetical protein A2468_04795 [Candidatus Falkowbacteria bacterium RIFOXYC2_FULL_46_15]OGF43028.1 MAG: hypothetical protein A2303_02680 [Candidatus Falkowbacteria bacterium RIFOXYB2_FULL_47_14]